MVEGKEPKKTNGGCFFKLFIGLGFTPPFLRGSKGNKFRIAWSCMVLSCLSFSNHSLAKLFGKFYPYSFTNESQSW